MPITPQGVEAMKAWFRTIDIELITRDCPVVVESPSPLDTEVCLFTADTYKEKGWLVTMESGSQTGKVRFTFTIPDEK